MEIMAGRVLYYHCVNGSQSEDDKRKMKRKEEEEVPRVIIDDFSDLSLISPPTKIRRLDVEFPPTPTVQFKHEDGDQSQLPQIQIQIREDVVAAGGELYMDEMEENDDQVVVGAGENVNNARALVLYRPVHHLHPHPHPHPHPHLHSHSHPHLNPSTDSLSFSIPSHLIPPLTDEILHNDTEKKRLAVVPWPPNNFNSNQSRQQEVKLCNDNSVEMEVEMEEQQPQQKEEERVQVIINANGNSNEGSLFADSSCHQRQDQNQNQNEKHCLAQQFPLHSAAPATPLTWSW